MTDIEWVDEVPMDRRKQTKYADLIADLKANAGLWALIDRRPGKPSASLSQKSSRLKLVGCEACIRTVDGEPRLYARWPE